LKRIEMMELWFSWVPECLRIPVVIKSAVCVLACLPFAVAGADTPLAALPAPREVVYEWMALSRWFRMHTEDVELAEKGEARVVFIGDSITEGWELQGLPLWQEYHAPLGAVNFGVGGDTTRNVLWRLDHGAVGNLLPDRVVLLIGTNNFGLTGDAPRDVAAGIRAVVDRLREVFPSSKLLLMGVFPTGEWPQDPVRSKIKETNALISSMGGMDGVSFCDIGEQFLLPDGRIDASLMPDFLHLSEAGYAVWHRAVMAWMGDEALTR
jgi:lysophospholipase L1-like esterase